MNFVEVLNDHVLGFLQKKCNSTWHALFGLGDDSWPGHGMCPAENGAICNTGKFYVGSMPMWDC